MSQDLRVELGVYMGAIVFSWVKAGVSGLFSHLTGTLDSSFGRMCELIHGGDQPHQVSFQFLVGPYSLK